MGVHVVRRFGAFGGRCSHDGVRSTGGRSCQVESCGNGGARGFSHQFPSYDVGVRIRSNEAKVSTSDEKNPNQLGRSETTVRDCDNGVKWVVDKEMDGNVSVGAEGPLNTIAGVVRGPQRLAGRLDLRFALLGRSDAYSCGCSRCN